MKKRLISKKLSKGMLMTALICGAISFVSASAYANDIQEFSLDEYVVTAARTETKLVDTPANISVISAEEIESRHYQDVSEVLKDVPGANVVDNGVGSAEKVVRLNGDERVLVLVDGRRVNSDMGLTSSARSSLDMNMLPDVAMIERIEVLKGAGGALYGSDAVGGVINIITKSADKDYGKVSVGFGSNNKKDMSAMYSIKSDKTSVMLSASKDKQDYFKYRDEKTDTTKKWPGGSNYENEKISVKVSQDMTTNTSLSIGYDYSNYEGRNPYDINNSMWGILDKETQNLYAKYDWGTKNIDKGYIQIYRNKMKYNNIYEDYITGNLDSTNIEETTEGIDIQNEFTISKVNKLVVGSSYRKTDIYNRNRYSGDIDNFSMFVSDNWEVVPSLTLNVGARYDKHKTAGNETTFSAGINKKFNDYSHAYINWSEVFKAPNTDDLFQPGGDPKLKPETGDTWSIGYATKLNESTDIGLNYFESNLDDAIDWAPGATPNDQWTCSNVDEQKKRGLELTVNHKINDALEFVGSYTYLKIQNNDLGQGFKRDNNIVPNVYRAGLRYNEGKWNANMYLRYGNGASVSLNGSKYPYLDNSYLTVDMTFTYKATDDLSFYAKAYNLFNESYAEFAGSYDGLTYNNPAQSRRFIVGAEYKF